MSSSQTSSPRRGRADAARNRQAILDAARDAFAVTDAEVSMAEIARRSGVGSATLYRNFANRHALLEALYVDEVDTISRAAATVEGDSPTERLIAWLDQFYAYFTSKRHVAASLLEHTDRSDAVFDSSRNRVTAAAQPLLHAAQATGDINDALTLDQILDMIAAIAKIHPDTAYTQPIVHTALAGLRTPPLTRAGATLTPERRCESDPGTGSAP